MTSAELEQFARQYAPLINLFPYAANGDPVYDPCAVDWYLDNVDFVSNGTTDQPPISEDQLNKQSGYLQIPDPNASSPVRSGNLPGAVAYVHVMPTPGQSGSNATYDLQYWFYYAVRGRSTLRLKGPTVPFGEGPLFDVHGDWIVPVSEEPQTQPTYQGVGEHQGDWKTLTIRINPTGQILGVFYGQHNSGIWCVPGDFTTTTNGGPIVYSARNTHSCFPTAGQFDQMESLYGIGEMGFSLLEWTLDGGEQWDTSQGLVIIADDTVKDFEGPQWNSFLGQWGPTYQQNVVAGFKNAVAAAGLPPIWAKFVAEYTTNLTAFFGLLLPRAETGADTPMQQKMWAAGPGALPQTVVPGQTTKLGPALAASDDWLFVGWTGENQELNVWPTSTGAFGAIKNNNPSETTNNSLAMTVFSPPGSGEDLVYVAWTGTGSSGPKINLLPMQMVNNTLKNGIKNKLAIASKFSPALATFTQPGQLDAYLYVAWADQSNNNDIAVSWSPSGQFDDGGSQTVAGTSNTGPALVAFNNALFLVWTDATNGNALNVAYSASGTFNPGTVSNLALNQSSSATPAAAVFQGSLYLAWLDGGAIQVWSSVDGTFSTGQPVTIPNASGAPALAVYNNLLYVAWTNDQKIYISTSDDGINFS